ncbi:hypothetical protein FHW79_002508 [Azospirillum sp. OGB3]|uniref:hypothetical protein n=1 Tax=Azospirillum sp. OGB3 TaxID=2587012 RepID=UPI0016058907|nr:hypothetical protein [Azospirillum sp. OGB3]MBB3264888.1 hypothetical protein [Azospirillum sp. OGB3]
MNRRPLNGLFLLRITVSPESPIRPKFYATSALSQTLKQNHQLNSVFTTASSQNLFKKSFCFPALDYVPAAQHHLGVIPRHGGKTQNIFLLCIFVSACILSLAEA